MTNKYDVNIEELIKEYFKIPLIEKYEDLIKISYRLYLKDYIAILDHKNPEFTKHNIDLIFDELERLREYYENNDMFEYCELMLDLKDVVAELFFYIETEIFDNRGGVMKDHKSNETINNIIKKYDNAL